MQNFSQSKNKFGYIYVLTPKGITKKFELTSQFLMRKINEYEALKVEINNLKSVIFSENDCSKEKNNN